jgi:hypothetical protein
MSRFDKSAVTAIAQIATRRRGSGRNFLPFVNRKAALLAALKRAEVAYENETDEIQAIEDHHACLTKIFDEEENLSRIINKMMRAWNSLSIDAKNDIVWMADYYLAIDRHGDREEILARIRRPASKRGVKRIVDRFEATFHATQLAANAGYKFPAGRKKAVATTRSKSKRSPLLEFAHELKLFWDKTMAEDFGDHFYKLVPFGIAAEIVSKAASFLPGSYTSSDFIWVKKQLQSSQCTSNEAESCARGTDMFDILRPLLPKGPRPVKVGFTPGHQNLGKKEKARSVKRGAQS